MSMTPDKERAGADSASNEPEPDAAPTPAEAPAEGVERLESPTSSSPEAPSPARPPEAGSSAEPSAPAPRAVEEARPEVEADREPEETAPPVAPAAPALVAESAAAPRRPFVRRHHWIVRLTHWVNAVVLVGMVASGLQIYGAYERFGIRGTKLPLPNPLDMRQAPKWMRLGGWLAGGINWHFFLMWPLVLNGLLYLGYLLLAGEWRPLLFRPRDLRPAIEMQKYYLHLRKEHPPQGKHNALQKGAYTFIVLLGVLSVLSGLALWKPVQLAWLTAAFGGYELARYWHFAAVWLFIAFSLVHVTLVFVVDPASLRAMITGWYRGRFPSHD